MTDIKLDSTGDIHWVNGETDTVAGSDEILQAAKIAMDTGRGEWAFDTSFGFPYSQVIGQRGVDETMIEAAVRSTLEPILGDGAIRSIEVTLDNVTRQVTINVDSVYGEIEATT